MQCSYKIKINARNIFFSKFLAESPAACRGDECVP
jgi:hypothetical protein